MSRRSITMDDSSHSETLADNDNERNSISNKLKAASTPLATTSITIQNNNTNTLSFSFFTLGLLNNASYCLMLACAKSISEGGTALVFIATVLPSLVIKASAPHWFHLVTYNRRMRVAAVIMGVAFVIVAYCHWRNNVHGQLFGVAVMALQGGLGEASLLALAGKLDQQQLLQQQQATTSRIMLGMEANGTSGTTAHELPQAAIYENKQSNTDAVPSSASCLTSFSSGTGLSGVFAFGWKVVLTQWIGWTLEATLLSGIFLALAYYYVFFRNMGDYLRHSTDSRRERRNTDDVQFDDGTNGEESDEQIPLTSQVRLQLDPLSSTMIQQQQQHQDEQHYETLSSPSPSPSNRPQLTLSQRFYQIFALWPYTVPLFIVYAAEYACMSGAWTAVGFPVTDVNARSRFYTNANWLYQMGVFVSRSSGTMVTLSLTVLWMLPLLQCFNLLFFVLVAANYAATVIVRENDSEQIIVTPTSWLYSPLLMYGICLYTGLLGGAVYVHGYKRIVLDKPAHETEFALAATSVAESIGILVADVCGLFMQSCLYRANGLVGAVVSCPL
ncbi:hypothetical protein MPSEU_000627700 [Mayamaea pseudoterrestris]|nr:hypothetical protein MPSEU_000627700 [Mayamaea pseudoterrestris]